MTKQSNSTKTATSKLQAGVAGAGGGTLLVLLANNLPPSNTWRPWLLIFTPSASVTIRVIASWGKHYFEKKLNTRELEILIAQSKETLRTALNNDQTSPEHKAELRKFRRQPRPKRSDRMPSGDMAKTTSGCVAKRVCG